MRIVPFGLVLVAVFFLASAPVFAADDVTTLQKQITDRQAHISELQKQIDAVQKSLQQKQLEKITLQNQLSLIGGRITRTKLDISQTNDQLQETQLKLQQTDLKIKDKEALISQEQSEIKELVRTLDFAERETVIQLLASGHTISDFFIAQESYNAINTKLTAALMAVQKIKIALDADHATYSNLQSDLESTQNKLESKQSGLQSQSVAKVQLLDQTKASETKYQQLVKNLKSEYSATENDIAAIERQVRAKLAAAQKKGTFTVPVGDVAINWPVPSHVINATFHDPDYPFRHIFEHPGVDIRAAQGTPIRAAAAGIVAQAKNAGMGYSYIILIHNNRISTLYGHVSRILVAPDDVVSAGDIIGYSGGTPGTPGAGPFVTGPHLHFEVRLDGIPVNPLEYLP